MSTRVSFADLLKKGAEKEKQKVSEKPNLIIVEKNDQPTPPTSRTSPTPLTKRTPPTTPTASKPHPVSPERDFTKVANSIVRDAVAQGLFIGKSKQIYDFLYLQTRGAIQPKRSVRITKSNLMRGADIGSERTLLKNLGHLKSIGLLKINEFDGQHGGNEYEVFLPEETHLTPPTSPTAQHSRHSQQKVGTLPPVETGVGGVGQTQENKDTYQIPKTIIKTNTNDDEEAIAFSALIGKFAAVTKELTGKGISKNDREKWENLADLLILELRTAKSRTGTISSVPAFLTEVLRRQFFTSRQQQSSAGKSAKAKPDTVGKSDSENFEIKPLDAKGREAALEQLQEFAGEDFLQDFKKWYMEEDWQWLMKELKKGRD